MGDSNGKWIKLEDATIGFNKFQSFDDVLVIDDMSGYILTLDEQYIIMAVSEEEEGDSIFVMKTSDKADGFQMEKSSIACPKQGLHHLIGISNVKQANILVIGYIRRLFGTEMPSNDVMYIVVKYY